MATLKSLNGLLTKASRSLDEAASQIKSLGLQPRKNIRNIAEILVAIFEIQGQIHAKRPDLIPSFLRNTDYARKMKRVALSGKPKSSKRA